jgi:Arc/MetJ-type ribon-helix-helix transcriptional regulator
MSITQVRLPIGLIKEVDKLVDKGLYTNKSDAIRDAVRRLIFDKQIGTIKSKEDSVKEVRNIRNKLSTEKFNFNEINKLH